MKCKSDPFFYQLLIEKSQIWGKKWRKFFYQTKNHYFLILNGETQNFPKNKDFLPNVILKLLSNLQEISTSPGGENPYKILLVLDFDDKRIWVNIYRINTPEFSWYSNFMKVFIFNNFIKRKFRIDRSLCVLCFVYLCSIHLS